MTDHPDHRPGENVAASAARIRKWLELHPGYESIAQEIASDPAFVSDGWIYRLYAIDRQDLEAVLDACDSKQITGKLAEAVDSLDVTCLSCPTQIEGRLPDGRYVYFRYRWGHASITVDGDEVYSQTHGDGLDGSMDEAEARVIIVSALTALEK
jgi:hypothetical protein